MIEDTEVVVEKTELEILKERAVLMGIKHSPNIGLVTLKRKVAAKQEGKEEVVAEVPKEVKEPKELDAEVLLKKYGETTGQRTTRKRKEAQALTRVRVTCMNPDKKAWEGEIFTVSNSLIGTTKKYVSFISEDGFYVPAIILNVMRERQYVHHFSVTTPKGPVNRQKLVKEFAIEELVPLTKEELKELAHKQAISKSLED